MKGLKWLKMSKLAIGRSSFGSSNLLPTLFLSVFVSCLTLLLFVSRDASAAVPGSSNVQAYVGYQSGNTWGDESIQTTPVNNEGQMLIYPTNMQKGAIFRFLFYPNLTAQTGVKGVIIKNVDLSFRIEDPYADSTVPDHNLCTAPHIAVGGISGWTGTVSNCGYWDGWDYENEVQYTHYHFDVVIQGNNSISITSSNLSPIYITVGTRAYNEDGHIPIYERALLASTAPVYFNSITYGSIQYATSATDALLQEMISHQDATTGAIEDLEQTTISNTDRTVSAINTLNTTIENQTSQQHDDYEAEVQREEDKQDELEDQAADLSISAQNPGNPFANLFQTSGCVSMPVFSGWFHRSDVIQVCSPYPQEVRPIIEFVTSVIVVGFLIKIYFKLFKGGYAS